MFLQLLIGLYNHNKSCDLQYMTASTTYPRSLQLWQLELSGHITKACLVKYIDYFTTKKGKNSDKKKSDTFHISSQNIDCVYSLEPPWLGGSYKNPQSMVLIK